ncbi:uncharacterized protein LOC131651250 [Vicia villosa]|uniref:uncharacterized protein LOC131651250 n=1 Tax=Vicia villosa TaxID=3911 RepID=UPI00273C18BA|nr:uncharacterized protein LOC131651250 [Vicia villosa]
MPPKQVPVTIKHGSIIDEVHQQINPWIYQITPQLKNTPYLGFSVAVVGISVVGFCLWQFFLNSCRNEKFALRLMYRSAVFDIGCSSAHSFQFHFCYLDLKLSNCTRIKEIGRVQGS